MQVHLKQSEIVAALKQYISGEGISLQGKTVDMTFTAGRKESGISVEISIEDASIPDFFKDIQEDASADAQAPAAPGLTLVQGTAPATASVANDSTEQAPAVETTAQATGTDDAFFNSEDPAQGKVVEAETTTLIPAGKSLFS